MPRLETLRSFDFVLGGNARLFLVIRLLLHTHRLYGEWLVVGGWWLMVDG